ncbi:hypothetical protein M231_04015 [Tremella mesenterica]|uniref:Uncharacterized protein n=1 Tax=Tremella mesenterica TaxID=5217 RepID=A0A4Q1BLM7_TREME|nr:hypothetical protein M231_04015 [Tremella mesenterica]
MPTFSAQERRYYDEVFSAIDKDDAGVLPGQDALPFLLSTNLPQQTLGEVWALADPDNNGFLTKEAWYEAARLIGWVQKGGKNQVEESLMSIPGPWPSFKGFKPPPNAPSNQFTSQTPISTQNTGQTPLTANSTGSGLPPLTQADRTKYTRIFVGCGPQNGLVSGDKARDVFVKSQLSYEKLGKIWNLADTQQRGSLDLPDFIIGMYLIQSCMANPSLTLPATLPPGTYEIASGGRPPPPPPTESPLARQHTGTASPIRPQYTGQGAILQPQRTGQSAVLTPPHQAPVRQFSGAPAVSALGNSAFAPVRQMTAQQPAWDVTPEAKANSDRFFAQLDSQNKGVIDGDIAVPFMIQSQLDEGTLATIWDLADIRREGKLTRDEFAVAMHLINSKLEGKDLPTILPRSLVPPSLRGQFDSGPQEVLSSTGPASATKDLFDLFSDEPAQVSATASNFGTSAPAPAQLQPSGVQSLQPTTFLSQPPTRRGTGQPASRQLSPASTGQQQSVFQAAPFVAPTQPPGDLLGDDTAQAALSVSNNSVELGNKQNQLANTTRNLEGVTKTRAELEATAASSAKQIEELEKKLSEAKAKYETETQAVADLRIRVAQQAEQSKKLQSEVISAESDLSAMRSEKDELGQALLRDKEEVRGLQNMMKEIEDEKGPLKAQLEKVKKEARQQKGMVTIAKKQLSTAEASRDSLKEEIVEAEKAAAEPEIHSETESAPTPFDTHRAVSPPVFAVAAAVPLPATPSALSPVPTGVSQRSNNPFERLKAAAQAQPPAPDSPTGAISPAIETSSPSMGTAALLGAGAAVGAAAGAVAAGAGSLFTAAKEAIAGEEKPSEKTPTQEKTDDLGKKAKEATEVSDPFAVQTETPKPQQGEEVDPFGAPTSGPPTKSAFDDFDTGFGDSFNNTPAASFAKPAAVNVSDFDTDFADFDRPAQQSTREAVKEAHQAMPDGIPLGIPKSHIPNLRPEAERSVSTVAVASSTEPVTPVSELTPSLVESSDTLPTQDSDALEPISASVPAPQQIPVPEPADSARERDEPVEELASSDEEEEGPEDLEAPNRDYAHVARDIPSERIPEEPPAIIVPPPTIASEEAPLAPLPTTPTPLTPVNPTPPVALASPVSTGEHDAHKTRRSAPPPPSSKTTLQSLTPAPAPAPAPVPAPATATGGQVNDFDPFGSSFTNVSLPPGAAAAIPTSAGPRVANFDDEDDFDFSDLTPAKVDPTPAQASGFDDEFANFDDEFGKPPSNGSDGSGLTKSYEIVPPHPESPRKYDEWGFGPSAGHVPPPAAGGQGLSFDDAFGGDFEPATIEQPHPVAVQETYAPPPGPPPASSSRTGLHAPALPERKDSTAPQSDDIEDVKRLCAMGFSRTLAIGALDANGYDFQKALNVLLQ